MPTSTSSRLADSAIRHVLFVCAGNICRSPIAEALFRHHAAGRPALRGVEVGSAGTIAINGGRPTREAVEVMLDDFALDIRGHRARSVDRVRGDLFLAMDSYVSREMRRLGVRGRVELLGSFAGFEGEEVDDPYGAPFSTYRDCARQIERLILAAIARLEREQAGSGPDPAAGES